MKKISSQEFEKLITNETIDDRHSSGIDVIISNYKVDGNVAIVNSDKSIVIKNCIFNDFFLLSGDNNIVSINNSNFVSITVDGHIKTLSIHGSTIGLFAIYNKSVIDFLMLGGYGVPTYIIHCIFGGCDIVRGNLTNLIIRSFENNGGIINDLLFEKDIFIEKYSLRGNHDKNSINHIGISFSELNIDRFVGGADISFINCVNDTVPNFDAGKKLLDQKLEDEFKEQSKDDKTQKIGEMEITLKATKHIIKDRAINITNSNLSKMQFHSCDFSNSNITINNTNLTDISATNFILPKNIQSENLNGRRENFRQLKYNANKNGDSYSALYYYMKEMNTLLNLSIRNFNIGDVLVLLISKISSSYGTNWIYALFWLVLLNVLGFVYFLDSSGIAINFNSNIDLIYLLNNLKFSYFLSNIENLSLFFDKTFSIKSEVIFYIMKIINVFLLYQLVISFRKFNKKF